MRRREHCPPHVWFATTQLLITSCIGSRRRALTRQPISVQFSTAKRRGLERLHCSLGANGVRATSTRSCSRFRFRASIPPSHFITNSRLPLRKQNVSLQPSNCPRP